MRWAFDGFVRVMWNGAVGLCFCCLLIFVGMGQAQAASIIGSSGTASAATVAEAIRGSSLNSNLKQYADDIGQLAMFESGGKLGVYNGSCCTGLLQMNRSNLAAQGLTPEQYANMGVNEQVEVWAKLTNSAANSAPVRQLMGMETFDGRKVDGSLVLACIQLGTGNCQTMLRSGSCSGFADKNGTTICKMADAMRGKTNLGTDSEGTKQDATKSETGDTLSATILESANKCWACTVIVKTGEVAVQVVPAVLEKLTSVVLPLMAVVFAIVTAFMIGRGFLWPGLMRWSDIWWNMARFVAVYALISISSFASEYVMGYAFYPSLQLGAAIGEMGVEQGNAAFGVSNAKQNCQFVQVDTSISFQANATIDNMSQLACKVHMAAYGPVVAGATLLSQKKAEATPADWGTGIVVSVISLFLIVASILALAAFAMSVVEALIKLAVTLSLSPIILFFWIFRRTRYLAVNGFNLLLYGVLLLAFSGLLASVSTFVLTRLIGQGMGQSGGNPTLEQVYNWVNTQMSQGGEVSGLVLFASFSIAAAMMASHLLRAGGDIAASLTGARMGQITNGVVAGVRSFAMISGGGPAVGAAMATGYFGTRAGIGAIGAGAAGVINGGKQIIGSAGRIVGRGGG
ncbi:hypothetical protein GCM10019059_36930 [Camelimonas fluminis]|uniref:TrbL/VirB6 plasmid conjugal transfer protein n=1 Tax=Camelimonas fluminis TaxID=1576911 RepID=A0ABV7UIH2_9HYPH|nr:hypothetical protein [Camelimonas fluminis]GHE73953.1 hypothetical protein GCM10019059_36930 [Camelimonas fluminis]